MERIYPRKNYLTKPVCTNLNLTFVLLIIFVSFIDVLNAQTINGTSYPFTNTTGAVLEDMSSGTTLLVAGNSDDGASPVSFIGFDFWFAGVRHTQFSVNANGLIRLGSTVVTGSFDNTTDFASTTNAPKIAPYFDDLWTGSNGKVHYKVIGTAPNRKLVIEWLNEQIPRVGGGVQGAGTFQAWLYEKSGVIEFVYGNGIVVNSTNSGYSIGLQAGLATNFASVTSAAPSVSYATAMNTQTNAITSGTKYTFTPIIPADPTNLTFTAVTGSGMTLNWTDNASNEVGYAIYRSTDNVNFTFITQTAVDVISSAQTGLLGNQLYYWKVYAVSDGGVSNEVSGSQATTGCGGGLSGTYSIGPTGAYPSLSGASGVLQAIITNGLAGPVILELQTAYVSAVETFPITFGNTLLCVNPTNTITVRPEAGAVALSITGSSTTATIDLNGANYITIDGRAGGAGISQLSIINTSAATGGAAVRFINEASNNTIQYVTLRSAFASASWGVVVFSTTTGANGNDNNLIDNCNIDGGAGALPSPITAVAQNGVYSLGTTTNVFTNNSGNTISNCNIYDNFVTGAVTTNAGILLLGGNTDWTITGNDIYQTATRTGTIGAATVYGISIASSTTGNNFVVTNNIIGGSSPGASGAPWTISNNTFANRFNGIGLSVAAGVPSSIQGNTITNFAFFSNSSATANSTSAPLGTGVWGGIYVGAGSANIGTNTGNTVGSSSGTGVINVTVGTNAGATANGIGVSGTGFVNINNNSIGGITTSGSTATISTGIIGVNSNSTGVVVISNNNVGSPGVANSLNASLASTGTTAQVVNGIVSTGTALSMTISNNIIANLNNSYSPAAVNTSRLMAGIAASSGLNIITGNTIRNFSTPAQGTGTTSTASVIGISMTSTSTTIGTSISQNVIHTLSNTHATAATLVTGIYYAGGTAGTNIISKNSIHSLSTSSTSATSGLFGIVVNGGVSTYHNNMIRLGVDASGASLTNGIIIVGIDKPSTAANNFYHNSIFIGGTGVASGTTNTLAFRRSGTAIDDVRNNIFFNDRSNASGTGKHYNIGINATTTLTLNYNVYYGTGTGFIQGYLTAPGGTDYATLPLWVGGSLLDANSSFGNPRYVMANGTSATVDLHIHPTDPTPIESAGISITSVTDDIDGQLRSGLTPVDIGADAGDFVSLDIASPSIGYTVLNYTCVTGDRSLTGVTISDASSVPVSGSLQPRVYYKKNIGGTWFSQQGTLASGNGINGTWDFTILASDMGGLIIGDVVYYYVIAQDMASTSNVGANPGGGLVASDVNTVTTPPTSPNNYAIASTLSGTYTVGTGGSLGTTLTSAINAFNTSCLSGPVVLELVDAVYASETFPIVIAPNADINSTNTLTIKTTQASTTITGSSATALILINGADYVTIDGSINNTSNTVCPASSATRDLTLTNTNTSTTSAVVYMATNGTNGATNNTIKNCIIVGNSPTTTLLGLGSGGTTIGSIGAGNHNNKFINNNVSKVQFGIFSGGAVAPNQNTGTEIRQNVMTNASPNNIRIIGIFVSNDNGVQITGNSIANISGSGADGVGISLGSNNYATSTTTGGEVINALVSKNKIDNIRSASTFSAIGIGVVQTASGTNEISNNMISNVLTNPTSGDFGAGIFVAGGTGGTTNIYYNSVSIFGTMTGGGYDVFGLAVGGSNPVIDIRNNIFVNTATHGTGFSYALGFAYSSFTNLTSNNNNLFTSGAASKFVRTASIANTGGTDYLTLAAWQGASGKDGASLNFQPAFISSADLHIDNTNPVNQPLNDGAVSLAGVTDDIDCDVRMTDIGADEFALAACALAEGGSATGSNSFCGSGVPSISASGYSVGSGSAYQWMTSTVFADYPNNGTTMSGQTNPASVSTGTVTVTSYYWLRVTCESGMTTDYSDVVTITINPSAAAITGPSSKCTADGPITLNETGGTGTSWLWSTTETTQSIMVSPSSTTIYTVTVTSPGGCTAVANKTVSVIPNPSGLSAMASLNPVCPYQEFNLSASFASISPILLNEGFESGATGWVFEDSSSTGVAIPSQLFHIQAAPYNDQSGSALFTNFSITGANFAYSNPDAGGSGSQTRTNLVSPSFNTVGFAGDATLTFKHGYRVWGSSSPPERVQVQISSDGGTSWATLANYHGTNVGNTTDNAQTTITSTVTVPASYMGLSNVKIRFRYRTNWGYYWVLDDVLLVGTVNYSYAWSSSPAGYVSNQQNPVGVTQNVASDYSISVTLNGCSSQASTGIVNLTPAVVMNASDAGSGSLRDIISCVGNGATITFDPSLTGVPIILTSEIVLNKNITIQGLGKPSLTISGGNATRLFSVAPGFNVTLSDMSLINANSPVNGGGAILVEGNLTLDEVLMDNNLEGGSVQRSMNIVPATPPAQVQFVGNVEIND